MGLNKEEAVKKIEAAEENSEFEVFTGEEHKTYLDNFSKIEVEKRIGDEISKVHTQYDNDIHAILGERKESTEKTYDFMKRKITELKEASGGTDELKSKIKKLEEDLKNKSGDEQLKKDYENLKKTYNEDKAAWEAKTQEFMTNQDLMKIEIQLDAAAGKLKFKEEIPESLRALAIQNAKAKLIKQGKMVEKKLVFVGEDGQTLVNKDNALNPFTAEEMMARELKDVLGERKVITGTGVKPTITEKDGKKSVSISIPDTVRTKEGLSRYLFALGLNRNSEEYKLAYAEYSENLPHE